MTRKPDFLVVGAPKCGTTFLNRFLATHPEIFMSRKEPHFFGRDLKLGWQRKTRSEEEYLSWFRGSEGAKQVGETSVWYLYSKQAADEIKKFRADARIIIMLRNPVDMLCSLHSQLLYTRNEDIEDFDAALAAEEDRRLGKRFPVHGTCPEILFYRQIGRFSEQVERYFKAFGPDRVHVIIHDDLVRDPQGTCRSVCHFLGVDAGFEPNPEVVNHRKHWRLSWLGTIMARPPGAMRKTYRAILPEGIRAPFSMFIKGLNTGRGSLRPIRPSTQQALRSEFAPDVLRLSRILGRDLSGWTASP